MNLRKCFPVLPHSVFSDEWPHLLHGVLHQQVALQGIAELGMARLAPLFGVGVCGSRRWIWLIACLV